MEQVLNLPEYIKAPKDSLEAIEPKKKIIDLSEFLSPDLTVERQGQEQ